MLKCINPFWRFSRRIECADKRHSNLTTVPDDIFRYERSLEELYLDANQIKDLPKHLFRLYKLIKLSLGDNMIEELPNEIGNLANLLYLDISKNDISQIPENIQHCKKLEFIDMSSNPLARLPENFTKLANLVNLCVNDISLIRVPPDIGSLQNIVVLEMRENLIKFLPESISFLAKLERLDIGSNEIDELPDSIGHVSNLKELWVDGNELVAIPVEIGDLKKLECLDLSENKLESLPEEISGLTALTDLMLSQNLLTDLPDGIGKLKKLSILKVDQNELDELTPAIGGLQNLTELILTDNDLESLPAAIGRLYKLSLFNIDRNRLSLIPDEIGNCTQLTLFSARDNHLTAVPKQIGNCRTLTVLDLSGNKINYLPLDISNLPLKALWLSENQAKSILKLQIDELADGNEKVLTCYLLPQQPIRHGSLDNFMNEVYDNPGDKRQQSFGQSVQWENEDEEPRESNLQRQLTPYPKDLKARHPKLVLHKQRSSSVEGDSDRDDLIQKEIMRSQAEVVARDKPKGVQIQETSTTIRIAEQPTEKDNVSEKSTGSHHDQQDGELSHHSEDEDSEERRVGFLANVSDHATDEEFRLKRKDTPHFLKGKRIVKTDEEKLQELMNNSEDKTETEETPTKELAEGKQTVGFTLKNSSEHEDSPHINKYLEMREEITVIDDHHSNTAPETKQSRPAGPVNRLSRKDTPRPKPFQDQAPSKSVKLDLAVEEEEEEEGEEEEEAPVVIPAPATPPRDRKEDIVEVEQKTITKVYEEITTNIIRDSQGLGINIAGGKGTASFVEDEEGIFISKIQENGPAARSNILRVGDKIVKVNDVDVSDADHHDAVTALKSAGDNVTLVILREIVEKDAIEQALMESQKEERSVRFAPEPEMEEIEVEAEKLTMVLKRDHRGLGFSIAGGIGSTPYKPSDQGIFISKISEGGPAAADGRLIVGDKVLSINGKDLTCAHHEDAVNILTNSGENVTMTIYRERIINKRMTPISKLNGTVRDALPAVKMVAHEETVTKAETTKAESIPNQDRGEPSSFVSGDKMNTTETVILRKGIGPLGLSIVGGSDHASHPFGVDDPGVFVSKILPEGVAAQTNLKVGDRILAVNNTDMRNATHHEAVTALIAPVNQIELFIRHDPPPPGLREIIVSKAPGEKLGISIRGGAKGHPGNPFDKTDEGIFISKVNTTGATSRDGRLKVGMRILEVNSQSMLGASHVDAVRALRLVGETFQVVVCDGYDADKAATLPTSGVIINPLHSGDGNSKRSQESISSVDRDASPVAQSWKRENWRKEELQAIDRLRQEREAGTVRLQKEIEEFESVDRDNHGRESFSTRIDSSLERNQSLNSGTMSSEDEQRPLTVSEARALEAEKRAAWRQARMKALEVDAMKAQVVIAQVKAMSSSSLEGSVVSDNEEKQQPINS